MLNHKEKERLGSIKIQNEVLGTIVAIAASKVPGIYKITSNFVSGIAELFGREHPERKVKVKLLEESASFELAIIVNYGMNIPEVTWQIQKAVKEAVEKQTGIKVKGIDINVRGVHLAEEQKVNTLSANADTPLGKGD